mmetsp:Transcript_17368/g.22893  ORF Transcript_17368/g.22893 Transcript_17368/m.22893 type:complete len:160 (-) Transcript_17368:219-698(-)
MDRIEYCLICYETCKPVILKQGPNCCSHIFCKHCLRLYLKTNILAGKFHKHDLTCPAQQCLTVIDDRKVRKLISFITLVKLVFFRARYRKQMLNSLDQDSKHSEELFKQWIKSQNKVFRAKRVKMCRCGAYIEKNGGCDSMRCINCYRTFSWSNPQFLW